MRHRLATHLAGHGLDLGPGHMPFPIPEGVTARTVDRLTPEAHESLFPELVGNRFPRIDVLCDFDLEGLGPFPDASEDFVVCSHVIEHLADPLGFLAEIHRVLRPDGLAVLIVPDRRHTFDLTRRATTFEHVLGDAGCTEVSDAHIVEYLVHVGPYWRGTPLAALHTIPDDSRERAACIDWHRRRSVHAHCWTAEEFAPLVDDRRWRIVEHPVETPEFGFVLQGVAA